MGYRDMFVANNFDADFIGFVPEKTSIQSGYCTIINSHTKYPYSAVVDCEYMLSDKGRSIWQKAMQNLFML